MERIHWNFEDVHNYSKRLEMLGLQDIIYEDMSKKDLSDLVLTVKKIIQLTEDLKPIEKTQKCEMKSLKSREEGNTAFKNNLHEKALECYNKALLLAPKNSEAMVLAYSNRSALLYLRNCYPECLKDIEKCFELNCPPNIIHKLKDRKRKCREFILRANVTKPMNEKFCEEYFKFDVKRNPQIPCASSDVGVIMESGLPKVVATNNVPVGSLLAIDSFFCSIVDTLSSCYYCQNRNLNLIPCDGCCIALFCDDRCTVSCMKDFHRYECSMMEFIYTKVPIRSVVESFRMTIKLRNKFKSWKEFAEASLCLGIDRIKSSTINEIFDVTDKFSMLSFKDNQPFIYGKMYNYSFYAALLIHYLIMADKYFPRNSDENESALRGFSRILMYNILHVPRYFARETVIVTKDSSIDISESVNVSPFIGKLKYSCQPNVTAVQLNKNIALIAVQPIKPNMELTISLRDPFKERLINKYLENYDSLKEVLNITCQCVTCDGGSKLQPVNLPVPVDLKREIDKYQVSQLLPNRPTIKEQFLRASEMLTLIKDYPFSGEYFYVWCNFAQIISFIKNIYCRNSGLPV